MADKIFNIIIKLLKQGGADTETVRGLTDIKNAMVAGTAVIGTMTAAYYTADKVIKATVGEFATYAKDVDVFSSALSTSAEQGSRLIQIADDLGISSDELQASLFRAVKNGMTPTVDGLAKMADEYNALATPQERADFLTKNFGKSSQELTRLLAEGSAGIKARNDAIESGLILDANAIQKQREYEAALDSSSDAVKALKIELGGDWIPFFTSQVNKAVDSIKGWEKGLNALAYNKAVTDIAWDMQRTDEKTQGIGRSTRALQQNYINMAIAAVDAGNSQEQYNATLDQGAGLMAFWNKQQTDATSGLEDYGNQLKDISNYAQDYQASINDIATAEQNQNVAELELFTLRKQGYSETSPQIVDQKNKITELGNTLDDLKTAQERQTASWVLGIITQQLSLDGLTSDEMQYLLDYQVRSGLISQSAADRAQAEYDAAMKAASGWQADYDAMRDKTVIHTTIERRIVEYEGVGVSSSASGGGTNPYDPDSQRAQWDAWQRSHGRAGGGSFTGWAMVGDAPGGRATPYTEYVYAPNGATIYNQSQMAGKSAPPMAAGGVISPMGLSDSDMNKLGNILARAVADAMQRII